MEAGPAPQETIRVRNDVLTINGDYVIIDAAHENPDWEVRDLQRMPIYLSEFKYFLRQRIAAKPPFAMRYLLERWPEDADFGTAPISFSYDEQYVAERDAEYARMKRFDRLGTVLTCLYPVLGFLWSGTKNRLIPAGFVPRSITGISIFTCVCLLLLQGTFIRMRLGLFTLVFGKIHRIEMGLLVLDYLLFAVIIVDVVLRFDQHSKNNGESPWGFGEWITKPFRRKPAEDDL